MYLQYITSDVFTSICDKLFVFFVVWFCGVGLCGRGCCFLQSIVLFLLLTRMFFPPSLINYIQHPQSQETLQNWIMRQLHNPKHSLPAALNHSPGDQTFGSELSMVQPGAAHKGPSLRLAFSAADFSHRHVFRESCWTTWREHGHGGPFTLGEVGEVGGGEDGEDGEGSRRRIMVNQWRPFYPYNFNAVEVLGIESLFGSDFFWSLGACGLMRYLRIGSSCYRLCCVWVPCDRRCAGPQEAVLRLWFQAASSFESCSFSCLIRCEMLWFATLQFLWGDEYEKIEKKSLHHKMMKHVEISTFSLSQVPRLTAPRASRDARLLTLSRDSQPRQTLRERVVCLETQLQVLLRFRWTNLDNPTHLLFKYLLVRPPKMNM